MSRKRPNLILFGVDSLWADHMSCYGYGRLTTPHIDRLASRGVLFEQYFCPHIPTTSAYASMLTGMDCFSTQVVALRHHGELTPDVRTLPEILRDAGYETVCLGFSGNPGSRGFDVYLDYKGWGAWPERPLTKAENLNEVTIPELERLASDPKPFFLFLRHMEPHSPYLPPSPFDRMFYSRDECDRSNASMEPVMAFKPFRDYFATWMPPGITDAEYVIAQYDAAIAYMDACIQRLLTRVEELGLAGETLIVLNGDHGETLMDHDCYFDHHGLYECTLHVPLIMKWPGHLPDGVRVRGTALHQDLVPTLLGLMGLRGRNRFDGKNMLPLIRGRRISNYSEFYITECTWMRKHGWRTPEWKLIEALEPDFHFKPRTELYNLIEDPGELVNLAETESDTVAYLKRRMEAWVQKRERETRKPNPMYTNLNWHGKDRGPFTTSQEAYDTLHIGSPGSAEKLQARGRGKRRAKRGRAGRS